MQKGIRGNMEHEKNIFFMAFMGEFVRFAVNVNTTVEIPTEAGIATQTSPMTIEGLLVDMDDDFYYLGTPDDGITHVVRVQNVVFAQLIQPESPFDGILDEMPDVDPDKFN